MFSLLQKRAWVAAYLRGAPQHPSAELQGYFDTGVVSIVDSVSEAIDNAVNALLNTINTLATPANFDWETATPEVAALVCDLDAAQTIVSHQNPVNHLSLTTFVFYRLSGAMIGLSNLTGHT